ncbi:hypothetical protein CISIN_1g046678mg [Citrus sinensis]|uniref:Knottin scorpion toxin-like domain-containing protein n=1 Tax=Citrus sinensis TaxID=2711 RepID=A0A067DB68_CITSI|nr:hypothetical protein CISIN_1g046678mg [Citrus sinensis]
MAKFTIVCFLLAFLLVSDGNMFLGAQANTCEKFWACNGDDQCKADCQKNYKGTGWCDFHKAIPPEKYCFCQYNC